jgi:hypothetical protein
LTKAAQLDPNIRNKESSKEVNGYYSGLAAGVQQKLVIGARQ